MKKITIPENWNEITISQLREIASLDTSNRMKYAISVASILCNEDSSEIAKLPSTALNQIVQAVQFVSVLPKAEYKQTITIEGKLYAVNDFKRFTLGQWIDIEEYGKNWKENLHKILAVIYQPAKEIDGELHIEPYTGIGNRERLFDQQKVSDVYGASVFFSSFAEQLTFNISQRALQTEIKILEAEMKNSQRKKGSTKIGRGIRLLIGWLAKNMWISKK